MKKIVNILLSLFILSSCSTTQPEDNKPKDELPQLPIETPTSVFNGSELAEDQETYQAFGIMISNSSQARPQSGIGLADVVYEIAVETYNITRFMAIFASEHPTKVGPVRSARIPFVRMIQEWGLPYAHYGSAETGRGDAKSLIESIKPPMRFDGHQGINNEFFFRSKDRKAPHNAYFNAEKALTKIPNLEYEKRFEFGDRTNIDQEEITYLSLKYSSYNPVHYEYDTGSESYKRFIHNKPMMDVYTDSQISVKNIIVLHASHTTAESVSYVLVDFIGEGKAEYFVNGSYEDGTWKKNSYSDITEFFDGEGNPIVLLPGNTWIQVVSPRVAITKKLQ